MLTSLTIKNIAIIDELTVDFERGLNVMTGETGAGKTMIAQSLGLVLGARAQSDIVRTGEGAAEVTASFVVDDSLPSAALIRKRADECGIDLTDGEIIVRRSVSVQGRSKIAINGVAVTLQMLKELAPHLVDVSSQHEHQLLIDPANHVDVVDGFGVADAVRKNYSESYSSYSQLKSEVDKLRSEKESAREKLDFYKFQLDELNAADPKPGELEELENERMRMKHAVALEASTRDITNSLYEMPGCATEVLGHVANQIGSMAKLDESVSKLVEAVGRAQAEVAEIARDVQQYRESLNADPGAFEQMEDRVHLLRGLVRKHGGTLDDAIAKKEELAQAINLVENYDERLSEKESALIIAENDLRASGKALARERKKAAGVLDARVQKELASLAMGKVTFNSQFKPRPFEQWDSTGGESCEFFIAPNIGEEMRPLAKTASGGELSRVMLAVKRVVADKASLASTYVFDEVDSGIGGATAEVVGRKLMEVAASHQVICITHLPQVACHGGTHFRIAKGVTNGRTVTSVNRLDDKSRVEEIARMLGGVEISNTTRKHAEELLRVVAQNRSQKSEVRSQKKS